MKPEFTATGLDVQTFDEIFTELSDGYKTIYGSDINLDQDSPDGQRVGIESNHLLDLQTFAAYLYSSLDPDLANGAMQDVIIKLAGLYRRAATRSTWDLSVTVTQNDTLDAGYTVKDDLGQEWEVITDTAVTLGVNAVTFNSVTYGSVEGISGATMEQVTFNTIVTDIEALVDATVGVDEETVEELRRRRNLSLENPAYSTTGGLFAKLANLTGVTDLAVYENYTDVYDTDTSLDAHSLWAVVEGGVISDIAEKIVKYKTAGTGLKGAITEEYIEELTRPDSTTFNIQHTVRFDRPVDTDIYVNVTATRKVAGSAVDIAALKGAIAAKAFNIGSDCAASELYENGYDGGTNFYLSALEVSDDDITFTDEIIDGVPGTKYSIDVANIDVTEVL